MKKTREELLEELHHAVSDLCLLPFAPDGDSIVVRQGASAWKKVRLAHLALLNHDKPKVVNPDVDEF